MYVRPSQIPGTCKEKVTYCEGSCRQRSSLSLYRLWDLDFIDGEILNLLLRIITTLPKSLLERMDILESSDLLLVYSHALLKETMRIFGVHLTTIPTITLWPFSSESWNNVKEFFSWLQIGVSIFMTQFSAGFILSLIEWQAVLLGFL